MLKLKMTGEQCGLFSSRLADREPKCAPLWDGNELHVPDDFAKIATEIYQMGFAHTGAELAKLAAWERFLRETSGITFNGAQIATDRESQSRITAAHLAALNDASFRTAWKTVDGKFITLDAKQMIELATAVARFVAACFTAEAEINGSIFSGALTAPEQIKAKFDAVKV